METVTAAFPFRRHVRTIWISDVHLGYAGCSADHLLNFLREMHSAAECNLKGCRVNKVSWTP